MPTYTYACDNGHALDMDLTIAEMEALDAHGWTCIVCNQPMLHRIQPMRKHIQFHESFYEHTTNDGVYCTSMGQLRAAAREAGNYSVYAEDMAGLFRAKEGRWI